MLDTQEQQIAYRFAPSDFEGILGLGDDLDQFYQALETYTDKPTSRYELQLRLSAENLFFTLKARSVEGFITPATFYEVTDYIGELSDGRL